MTDKSTHRRAFWVRLTGLGALQTRAQSGEQKFATPPGGHDTRRESIERGKLESIGYDSTTVGIKRRARVYTPPEYAARSKIPSLVPPSRYQPKLAMNKSPEVIKRCDDYAETVADSVSSNSLASCQVRQ